MQIPKKIHFVLLGKQKSNPLFKKCLETWKKNLQEWEFVEWNEDNVSCDCWYTKYCFENKKWAFLSDYLRLQALFEQGGVYLDTDMYIIKDFTPLIQNVKVFFGEEEPNQISCGIIGAKSEHYFIKKLIDYYRELKDPSQIEKIPIVVQSRLSYINKAEITVFPQEYFYSYELKDKMGGEKNFMVNATSKSYAVHLWEMSWISTEELILLADGLYGKGFKMILKNVLSNPLRGWKYYKDIFYYLKKYYSKS